MIKRTFFGCVTSCISFSVLGSPFPGFPVHCFFPTVENSSIRSAGIPCKDVIQSLAGLIEHLYSLAPLQVPWGHHV